jgi:hypothetical protein
MSLADQLAQLAAANPMGPAEVKSKKATDLYTAYLKAKDTAAYAPEELRDAERAYYSYVQGEDGYAAKKSTQNSAEFKKIQKELERQYEEDMRRLNGSVDSYDATRTYAVNLSAVSMRYFNDLAKALEERSVMDSAEQTGYRKTYYLDQEMVQLKMANIAFNLLLISLAIVFWKKHAYDKGTYYNPVAWIGGVLILFSSLIVASIVYKIMKIKPPKNVYLDKSTLWSGTKLSQNYT